MNIVNILEEIEKVDGDVYERLNPRRKAMQDFFGIGSKIAMAAMPLALGSMFQKAYGQVGSTGVVNVLQYALTLHHFAYNFFVRGYNEAPIPAGDKAAIQIIRDSEGKHVDILKYTLTSIGTAPVAAKSSYDFSAGTGTPAGAGNGPFKDVFTNYVTFLAVAQALEDTSLRAYKGRLGELLGQKTYLTPTLGIHAVEARNAAKIRFMRRMNGHAPNLKVYITGSNDSGVAAVNGWYVGEDNVVQGGLTVTSFPGVTGNISVNAATEAFDEPLTAVQVLALVAPFGVS